MAIGTNHDFTVCLVTITGKSQSNSRPFQLLGQFLFLQFRLLHWLLGTLEVTVPFLLQNIALIALFVAANPLTSLEEVL